MSNKAEKRRYDLSKMSANKVFRAFLAGDDDLPDLVSDSDSDSDDESDDSGEHMPTTQAQRTASRPNHHSTTSEVAPRLVIDSGCSHRHVVSNPSLLRDTVSTNIRVEGAYGPPTFAKLEGKLGNLPGRAIALENGNENLASLMTIMKEGGGSFSGDAKVINIYDRDGNLALEAPAHGGGWSVPLADVVKGNRTSVFLSSDVIDTNNSGNLILNKALSFNAKIQLTAEEIRRADSAGKLHELLGHPSERVLLKTIESGIPNSTVTATDLKNWYALRGKCAVCLESKMRNAPARAKETAPPSKTGEELHGDILQLKSASIGGSTHVLFVVDRRSRLVVPVLMKNKQASTVAEAWKAVIAELNQHGHLVRRLITDREATLNAAADLLKTMGITHQASAAGRHATFAERYIQTLKGIKRCIKAGMTIELPDELDGELTLAAAQLMNKAVRGTSKQSAHEMVKGVKPKAPAYRFGQTGLFFHKGDSDYPAEWGMYVGHEKNGSERTLRAYLFSRPGKLYSRYKFEPNDNVPFEALGLKRRLTPKTRKEAKRGTGVPVVPLNQGGVLTPSAPHTVPTPVRNQQVQSPLTSGTAPSADDNPWITPRRTAPAQTAATPHWATPPRTTSAPTSSEAPAAEDQLGPVPRGTPRTRSRPQHINTMSKEKFATELSRNMKELESKIGPAPVVAVPPLPAKKDGVSPSTKAQTVTVEDVEDEDDVEDLEEEEVAAPVNDPVSAQSGHSDTSSKEEALREAQENADDAVATHAITRQLLRRTHELTKEAEDYPNPWLAGKDGGDPYCGQGWRNVKSYRARQAAAERGALEFMQALRMSYREAVNSAGDQKLIDDSVEKEVRDNIVPCGYAVDYHKLSSEAKKGVLNSFLFMKDKYLSDGEFERWKARLVVNGSQQCIEKVGDTFAPTVNTASVMVMLQALADSHKTTTPRRAASWDIAGAFVTTKIPRGVAPIYVRLPKEVAAIWLKIKPEDRQYVLGNGTMVIRLTHYLYGLRESPERFSSKLRKHLVSNGLVQSKADPCVFSLCVNGVYSYIATWVDDLLGVLTDAGLAHMRRILKKEFTITEQLDNISYLGMQISHDKLSGKVTVHQGGMIDKLLKRYTNDSTKEYPMPANKHLVEKNVDSPEISNPKDFRSPVMALMYLARLSRPDIMHAVSVLATNSAKPTEESMDKLERLFGYLKKTRSLGICFKKGDGVLRVYADASHGLHPNGNGHGGIVITYGSAPIFSRSWKLKITTRSSSESELVVLEEASTFPAWLTCLLQDLHIANKLPTIYQDNKSTMILAVNGGNFGRTKHLIIKKSFVKQGIKRKEFRICYLPTEEMLADWQTKPMTGPQHLKFLKRHHMCVIKSRR
jgi:hypothetical protein